MLVTVDKNKFKGGNNALRTSSLFYERWQMMTPERQAVASPVFSIHSDVEGLINARRTFLDEGDPTGYKWAVKYLDGWQHFLRLRETQWFNIALDLWLSELHAKMQAEALKKVEDIAKSPSKSAFQAAKYLADKGWIKPLSKRGRPSKDEINNELRRATQTTEQDEDDFKRAAIKLVASN